MNLTDISGASEYADIFNQRGHSYHAAMAFAPHARDLEFAQLFSRFPCQSGERLIDAPSGGAYLEDFLQRVQAQCRPEVVNLEFSPGFGPPLQIVDPSGPWPLPAGWADRAICLAASHHIGDLDALLENFRRHLRLGGLLQIADVEPGDGIAEFLDVFVDRYTGTGHQGLYRSFSHYCWPDWVRLQHVEKRHCPWRFATESQMLTFCMNLFGLNGSAMPELRDALDRYVGMSSGPHGVELDWRLVYVEALREE